MALSGAAARYAHEVEEVELGTLLAHCARMRHPLARLLASLALGPVVAGAFGAACATPPADPPELLATPVDSPLVARAHDFNVGANEWPAELKDLEAFRAASGTPASVPRLCHIYTYWDVAHHDPAGATGTHRLDGLIQWLGTAQSSCDEVLITFQGPQQKHPVAAPSAAAFEHAFVAFQSLTDAGRPLASWHGKLSFTPWNEPNNPADSGNGLEENLSPELAAQYYLVARKHCGPASKCKVAAGDFATNGGTADDVEWNCADDGDPGNTPGQCASPSSENPGNKPPSYLDRYKNYLANHATDHGLPSGFRPEVFAYHPWHDVNSYLDTNAKCSGYGNCATRRLLQSLGGSWGGSEIWDSEIGVGLQNATPPDEHTTQPCGAAFLVQLTDLSPRFTRVYYMMFAGGHGPLFDGAALRPAGKVLADRATHYGGAKCADTGITVAGTYTNPIIPMFERPAGVSASPGAPPTEGCPDPTGIKTSSGEYYIYCTSYTFPYSRHDGFPIFKSDDLAGNQWARVGSLIPDSGAGRSSWPSWIKDHNGTRFGLFWAPDVHELPNGKFAATYAAPCGDTQCVGLAWADGPTGPWTHKTLKPFISHANNGPGLGGPGHMTYDPNLLVTSDHHLYLYWVVAGAGIWGAPVSASASGELGFQGAPRKVAPMGEGPYMIERGGTYYLFYSDDPTGGILYNYQVHVRRAASPLAFFTDEGPEVLHKSNDANGGPVSGKAFVATGGNSVIQSAIGGVDYMVYHAIVVPDGKACPAADPTGGSEIKRDAVTNPYCRAQGERQAMTDPITWVPDGQGGEWPTVNDGTPSHSTEAGSPPAGNPQPGNPGGGGPQQPPPAGPAATWFSLGGVLASDVAVAPNHDGRLEAFARGSDGALYHLWQTSAGGAWSDWARLGGPLAGNPVIGTNADGRLEVFARGTDNAVWHASQTTPGGAWSGFGSLDGGILGDPAVAADANGHLEVFARGGDDALWHRWWKGSDWAAWSSLGGTISTSPAAVRDAGGRLEVFAGVADGALFHLWQTAPNGGWSGWGSLGGSLASAPAAAMNADGRAEVFARGTDGALWHAWQNVAGGGWHGFSSLGGGLLGRPRPVKNADGRLEVFAAGTDGALYHLWQASPGASWSGWSSLGGALQGDPAPALNADGRVEVFVEGTNAALFHRWQSTPGGVW